jgi:predicted transposase YdaD
MKNTRRTSTFRVKTTRRNVGVLLVLVSGMKLYPYQFPAFLLLTLPTLEQTAHARLNELHLQKFSLLSKLYFTNQRSIPF